MDDLPDLAFQGLHLGPCLPGGDGYPSSARPLPRGTSEGGSRGRSARGERRKGRTGSLSETRDPPRELSSHGQAPEWGLPGFGARRTEWDPHSHPDGGPSTTHDVPEDSAGSCHGHRQDGHPGPKSQVGNRRFMLSTGEVRFQGIVPGESDQPPGSNQPQHVLGAPLHPVSPIAQTRRSQGGLPAGNPGALAIQGTQFQDPGTADGCAEDPGLQPADGVGDQEAGPGDGNSLPSLHLQGKEPPSQKKHEGPQEGHKAPGGVLGGSGP